MRTVLIAALIAGVVGAAMILYTANDTAREIVKKKNNAIEEE